MKKKKSVFNYEQKALFEETKKKAGITSKEAAEALDLSPQTMTSMSGKLTDVSVLEFAKLSFLFKIEDVAAFLNEILLRSPEWLEYIERRNALLDVKD